MIKFLGKTIGVGTIFLTGAACGAAATFYLVMKGMEYLDELDESLNK